MKVKWEFFEGNIPAGNFLALLKKDTGKMNEELLMYVYADSYAYKAIPYSDYSFIGRIIFPYKEAKDYVRSVYDCSKLSVDEVSFKCLEYACSQIELNFQKRVSKLIQMLS